MVTWASCTAKVSDSGFSSFPISLFASSPAGRVFPPSPCDRHPGLSLELFMPHVSGCHHVPSEFPLLPRISLQWHHHSRLRVTVSMLESSTPHRPRAGPVCASARVVCATKRKSAFSFLHSGPHCLSHGLETILHVKSRAVPVASACSSLSTRSDSSDCSRISVSTPCQCLYTYLMLSF